MLPELATATVSRMRNQEESVYKVLTRLLLAGRLPPGTQLVESRLAAVFGVSRERVRKVLHRLGHDRLLELIPNRGAFVTNPTLEQAREIYDARRVLEGGIAAHLSGRLSPAQQQALAEHAVREQAALLAGDRASSIRLSAQFHLLLASFVGSAFIETELQELVSRTSMLVAFFEPEASSACGCDEHADIAQALLTGDTVKAFKSMQTHLSLIETRLRPRATGLAEVDLEREIRVAWAQEIQNHGTEVCTDH